MAEVMRGVTRLALRQHRSAGPYELVGPSEHPNAPLANGPCEPSRAQRTEPETLVLSEALQPVRHRVFIPLNRLHRPLIFEFCHDERSQPFSSSPVDPMPSQLSVLQPDHAFESSLEIRTGQEFAVDP